MRNNIFIRLVSAIVILMSITSCKTNSNLSSALSDINKHRVSQRTINKLENSRMSSGYEAESYYSLARIYHFDSQLRNLDEARSCYQKVISMYNMPMYESQTNKLSKKYNISSQSLQKMVSELDGSIYTMAFGNCLKSNTLQEYAKFVKNYPNSNFAKVAKDKALELQKSNNTMAGYVEYLSCFPGYRKDDVIQNALDAAKKKNSRDAYCDFLNHFAEIIDDVSKFSIPIYQSLQEYTAVYNQCLRNKNAQTRAKFTTQFINEQSKYCSGNEQRIRALCKQSPFPFEINDGNKYSIKRLMQSVKVNQDLVFYTESNKGFIMHDGNLLYEGGISGGLRNGQGKDSYYVSDEFSSGIVTYEGGYKNGYFHGTGTYTDIYGWWKRGNWNYGKEEGSFEEGNNIDHEDISHKGMYVNGQKEGVWDIWHCPEGLPKSERCCSHRQENYSNGTHISTNFIADGRNDYYNYQRSKQNRSRDSQSNNITASVEYYRSYKSGSDDDITEYHVTFGDGTRGTIAYNHREKDWYYSVNWYAEKLGPSFLDGWHYAGKSQQEAIDILYKERKAADNLIDELFH